MDNNQLDGQSDIARFLEKFNQPTPAAAPSFTRPAEPAKNPLPSAAKQEQYNQSFEKLEEKIRELEEKFEASAAQNEAVMRELARTREAVENQKSRDGFYANITATIANLKESVENLSRAQQAPRLYNLAPAMSRTFDAAAPQPLSEYTALSYYQPDTYRQAQQAKLQQAQEQKEQALQERDSAREEKNRALADLALARTQREQTALSFNSEREEKARIISSLQQKASQLKAVNVALDREIKRTQQEKLEALRKSAEQAKEILSLRDALTAAEERFKSFDFEGRIISVKRQYQQKVTTLENQLHEISNTCMRQVEEIESLKAENLKLHQIAEEREQLAALYEAKTHELEALQASVATLRSENDKKNQARLAAFTHRMQNLQQEHEALAQRLTQAQQALQSVSAEKQTLEENFKTLLGKIEKNDAVIESLKQKIEVLTAENRELKDRPAAKPAVVRPQAPKEPVTVRQPLPAAKPAAKTMRAPLPSAPEEAPVGMQNTLRSKVQTEADLPEIRVAEPVPQEELYNGEDFLEKTDSFIGRMKWSIFREDK